ncbi:hypothetical protein B0H13DRAFT_1875567 [Mycena leptocephala]|nr:hypothetical protein B0H13DRAFT_1875567 [Mycena leptocephala]
MLGFQQKFRKSPVSACTSSFKADDMVNNKPIYSILIFLHCNFTPRNGQAQMCPIEHSRLKAQLNTFLGHVHSLIESVFAAQKIVKSQKMIRTSEPNGSLRGSSGTSGGGNFTVRRARESAS